MSLQPTLSITSKLASYRTLAAVPLAAAALVVSAAAPTTSIPIAEKLGPETAAAASPMTCITLGRNLVGFASSGNPALAINAARRVPGCGNFNAGAICSASRQPWGAPARAIVRFATWGRYDRC